MGFWDRLFGGRKDSAVGALIAMRKLGKPVWSERDYASFAREAYMQNVIAYRCIRLRAEACSAIPILEYQGDDEITESDLLAVLAKPNPWSSGEELVDALISFYSISGNGYLEAVTLDGNLEELYALRPDRMQVIAGRRGYPKGYRYKIGSAQYDYDQEVSPSELPPIMHMREFHPLNDWYGLSPVEAAAFSIDVFNAAGGFNKALLDNMASPSGALVFKGSGKDDDQHLSEDAFARLKAELETQFSGPANAGRPMLLDGGLEWQSMGMTPRELEFVGSKREAAREICLAFGVPPMLLGIPGDNTYSNYREANRAFYRSTVIPLMSRTVGAITNWVQPLYEGARLGFDLDQIEALADERAAKWEAVQGSEFLTTDEKRDAVGYQPYKPGSEPGSHIIAGAAQMPLEDAGFQPGGPEPVDE